MSVRIAASSYSVLYCARRVCSIWAAAWRFASASVSAYGNSGIDAGRRRTVSTNPVENRIAGVADDRDAKDPNHAGWSADDWQTWLDERAAIAEFEGGLSHAHAEALTTTGIDGFAKFPDALGKKEANNGLLRIGTGRAGGSGRRTVESCQSIDVRHKRNITAALVLAKCSRHSTLETTMESFE